NPYYTESYPVGGDVYVDYSQPIACDEPVSTTEVAVADATTAEPPSPAIKAFDSARQAFYKGDYASALAFTNKALTSLPNDPIIHEFRSLVLFAQRKYADAAAGLYSVLSVGPGWDWTTLSSLYPSVDTYTKQLRNLESYVKDKPKESDARFVLAYHDLTMGKKEASIDQLQQLKTLLPNDHLIKELLLTVGGNEALGSPTPTPAAKPDEAPAIAAADLVGNWSSKGENSSKFA